MGRILYVAQLPGNADYLEYLFMLKLLFPALLSMALLKAVRPCSVGKAMWIIWNSF